MPPCLAGLTYQIQYFWVLCFSSHASLIKPQCSSFFPSSSLGICLIMYQTRWRHTHLRTGACCEYIERSLCYLHTAVPSKPAMYYALSIINIFSFPFAINFFPFLAHYYIILRLFALHA